MNRKQRRAAKKYERYIGTDRENRIHKGYTKSTKPKVSNSIPLKLKTKGKR